jgi:hypothetical protein
MFNQKILTFAGILFIWIGYSYAQTISDLKIDSAYFNARKGIYWGLSNLTMKKSGAESDLIINDKKISSVKIDKQVNGFKILSTGYFESYEVQIKLFKSNDALTKEGYMKPDSLLKASDRETSSKRR